MQPKKNASVDLEKSKPMYIQVEMVIALSLLLISLEWTSPQQSGSETYFAGMIDLSYEDVISPTIREPLQQQARPTVLIPFPVDEEVPEELWNIDDLFNPENTGNGISIYIPEEQEEVIPDPVDETQVEIMAEFPGGKEAMMRWIYSNIQYPEECVENGVEGRVTARFTINKLGNVEDIEIVRSVHPDLDAEVIRVLKLMPKFSPAIQNHKLVPVYMYWPVVFKLN